MSHLIVSYFKQIDGQIALIVGAASSRHCRLQITSDYFSLISILCGYSAVAGGRTALLDQWQLEDHEGGVEGECKGYHIEGIIEPPCEKFKCQQIYMFAPA
jgi:hypothetical protein